MAKHADAADRQLNEPPAAEASSAAGEECSRTEERGAADGRETNEHVDESAGIHGQKRLSDARPKLVLSVAIVLALACLTGWLGYGTYQSCWTEAQRNELVAVARQGALNLTTIDYTKVDTDVQRILDSSTGTFHEDFQKRSQPFIDVVKKAQSKSEGIITAAGLESQDGDQAQVLVSVTVKTSNIAAREQESRMWRMRIGVRKVGDSAKVTDVQFVP